MTDDELIARAVTFLRWTESQRSAKADDDFRALTVDSMPLRRFAGDTIHFERNGTRAYITVVVDRQSGKIQGATYYLPPPEATPSI